ncbi:alpha-xenorhabdolysin family binary toxin subunit A [Pseudomonas sp. MH9.2]|uniref:alpha-xenorhabdolysin family binary toxin subunit A n=1 Tax=unclassified Pseudomonas TaxID=196821 RepID=UPI002AC89D2A|nr:MULTISPECIES: alpha-xenorhabdolysin family binary toxin subunit A [unclassified Pseudomonas]MEB0008982.1 alpha-xenorhabdolysin family binary toxin subunit A [Pseudomonas sp. RTB2]MEB0017246.1 alpha-xenorhabdolysin family binary toxin subunit A [Pseudomonas sp. RTB3]MEB0024584.1 alpha-xenorhabdolysin family binary toxin subunit A [Pseudomonas sp. MH9.2]MEB0148042.1 alpha-xenorhabdolysin family binary toxin subunit A [Pseudomonas sp. CCC2.2]MEB0268097.1 alpha-xenorhabdolysin family binary tox
MNKLIELKNDDTLEHAVTKPLDYLKISTTAEQNGGRGSALILTKEDILTIKRYEKQSLNFPLTLAEVENHLGFKTSNIKGLEPIDILQTYTSINAHAKRWAPLESEIKLVGTSLDIFATSFTVSGQRILNIIDRMDILDQLELTVADLSLESIQDLPLAPLNPKDQKIKTALVSYLNIIAADIAKSKKETHDVKQKITHFAKTLAEQLIPSVNDKITLTSTSNLNQKVTDLEKDIDELTSVIDQKNKEYKSLTTNVAWGGFGGPIGLIVVGGILGAKAEKIRKEKNSLIAEKNKKISSLKIKRPLVAALHGLSLHFQNMEIRMLDAEQSSKNLEDMWAVLAKYIDHSAEELESINNTHDLLTFAVRFERVVSPWHTIKNYTHELLIAFESALTEYKLSRHY